jgi:membrane protein DedA with SNARE-associated domain
LSGLEGEVLASLGSEVARLQPILDRYGLWALAVATLAEGAGLPLPGQTLLIACALLAVKGGPDIVWVLLVAWWATWAGDLLGYWIGRFGLGGRLGANAEAGGRLARVQALFAQWGIWLLVVARFLDGVRQTSNIAAGAFEMPWRRFLAATAVGTSLWVGVYGLGFYLLDADRQALLAHLHGLRLWGWGLAILALLVLALYLGWRRSRKAG